MRKLVVVVGVALALACGGGSDGGGSSGGLSGTVGGRSFTVQEVRAVSAGTGTTPCPVPVLGSIGAKAIALEFTSYADACGDVGGQCRRHANGQRVTVLHAKIDPSGKEPALKPGTYTVQASATVALPDGSGLLDVAYAESLASGAAPECGGTPSPSVTGGTLRLDQVTGSAITGHVSITFQDGGSLQGDFSAPLCPGTGPDVCALATTQALCAPPVTCVP